MNLFRIFGASFALIPVVAQAAPVDFGKLNSLFSSIAGEVIKLEQVKDKSGKDLIDHLALSFDTKESDLDKGKLSLSASTAVLGSRWAPSGRSDLSLGVNAQILSAAGSDDQLRLKLDLRLKSQVLELVKVVAADLIKKQDPCSASAINSGASSAIEEAFNQAYCDQLTNLSRAKDFDTVLSSIQTLIEKRTTYVADQIALTTAATSAPPAVDSATELKVLGEFANGFKTRTSSGDVSFSYADPKGIDLAAEFFLMGFSVQLTPSTIAFSATIDSKEGAAAFANYKSDIEYGAALLTGDPTDPTTQAITDVLKKTLRDYIKDAKGFIF